MLQAKILLPSTRESYPNKEGEELEGEGLEGEGERLERDLSGCQKRMLR